MNRSRVLGRPRISLRAWTFRVLRAKSRVLRAKSAAGIRARVSTRWTLVSTRDLSGGSLLRARPRGGGGREGPKPKASHPPAPKYRSQPKLVSSPKQQNHGARHATRRREPSLVLRTCKSNFSRCPLTKPTEAATRRRRIVAKGYRNRRAWPQLRAVAVAARFTAGDIIAPAGILANLGCAGGAAARPRAKQT